MATVELRDFRTPADRDERVLRLDLPRPDVR
jgi:hypothetical protein